MSDPNRSKEAYEHALARLVAMTTLPKTRVEEVLEIALRGLWNGPEAPDRETLERAVMLASERLWAEQKATKEKPR